MNFLLFSTKNRFYRPTARKKEKYFFIILKTKIIPKLKYDAPKLRLFRK